MCSLFALGFILFCSVAAAAFIAHISLLCAKTMSILCVLLQYDVVCSFHLVHIILLAASYVQCMANTLNVNTFACVWSLFRSSCYMLIWFYGQLLLLLLLLWQYYMWKIVRAKHIVLNSTYYEHKKEWGSCFAITELIVHCANNILLENVSCDIFIWFT